MKLLGGDADGLQRIIRVYEKKPRKFADQTAKKSGFLYQIP